MQSASNPQFTGIIDCFQKTFKAEGVRYLFLYRFLGAMSPSRPHSALYSSKSKPYCSIRAYLNYLCE